MTFAMQAYRRRSAISLRLVVVSQLVVILTPAMLMTVMLTRSPSQTLLLKKPVWWTLPSAALLAVALHPTLRLLQLAVKQLYPVSPVVQESLHSLRAGAEFLDTAVAGGVRAGNLRRAGVPRIYFVGISSFGPQMVGDCIGAA